MCACVCVCVCVCVCNTNARSPPTRLLQATRQHLELSRQRYAAGLRQHPLEQNGDNRHALVTAACCVPRSAKGPHPRTRASAPAPSASFEQTDLSIGRFTFCSVTSSPQHSRRQCTPSASVARRGVAWSVTQVPVTIVLKLSISIKSHGVFGQDEAAWVGLGSNAHECGRLRHQGSRGASVVAALQVRRPKHGRRCWAGARPLLPPTPPSQADMQPSLICFLGVDKHLCPLELKNPSIQGM